MVAHDSVSIWMDLDPIGYLGWAQRGVEGTCVMLRFRHETSSAQVRAGGGLLVISTSMQESKRVENQLKGRAGRQVGGACAMQGAQSRITAHVSGHCLIICT